MSIDTATAAAEKAATFEELLSALAAARVAAGQPSFAELEKQVAGKKDWALSKSTMSAMFKNPASAMPTYQFVRRFAHACGVGDKQLSTFEDAWYRIDAARKNPVPVQRQGEPPATDGEQTHEDHLATLAEVSQVAHDLTGQPGVQAARRIYARVHEVTERLLGQEHERTLQAAHDLANALAELGEWEPARHHLRTILAVYREQGRDDDPITLRTMDDLAIVQIGRGAYEQARQLAEECLAARTHAGAGQDDPEYVRTAEILIFAVERSGKPDEAARLRRLLLPGAAPAPAAGRFLRRGH